MATTPTVLCPRDLQDIHRRVRTNEVIHNVVETIPGLILALGLVFAALFICTKPAQFEDWGEAVAYALTHTTPGP